MRLVGSAAPKVHTNSPCMFEGMTSVGDFAYVLQVPAKALDLVVPDDARCVSSGCLHSAIRSNCGYCPVHRCGWYPLLNGRAGRFFGPTFFRIARRFRI